MPEIRIRYEDDSDLMPYRALAAVQETAAQVLTVVEFEWIRDDDLDDEPAEATVSIGPDLGGLSTALSRSLGARQIGGRYA